MYLLVGDHAALLIDSGTQSGEALASLLAEILGGFGLSLSQLIVGHTHSHLDHRSGDEWLRSSGARVVPAQLEGVIDFWGFRSWPNEPAHFDLGGRRVEVLPLPGHNENSVVFLDDSTGILFSGDSLLRGKINVTDAAAFRASVLRLSEFLGERAPLWVLGGHLERSGQPLALPYRSVQALRDNIQNLGWLRPRSATPDFVLVFVQGFFGMMGGAAVLIWIGRVLIRRRRVSARPTEAK